MKVNIPVANLLLPTIKQRTGFTIVELIVVIIISAVIVGSLGLTVSSHTHISQKSRDLVALDAFVENKVESLRSKGFLGVSIGTTDITSELPSELDAPRSASQHVTTNTTSTKRIEIMVTYNDRGSSRTYSYTTLLGELGVGQY